MIDQFRRERVEFGIEVIGVWKGLCMKKDSLCGNLDAIQMYWQNTLSPWYINRNDLTWTIV